MKQAIVITKLTIAILSVVACIVMVAYALVGPEVGV